jgi:hypothetical protein
VSTPRTLFVGKNMSGICWYRCALPRWPSATSVGVREDPPELQLLTGLTKGPFEYEHLFDYDAPRRLTRAR